MGVSPGSHTGQRKTSPQSDLITNTVRKLDRKSPGRGAPVALG